MSNSMAMVVPDKLDTLARIRLFMSNEESGVVLTAKEERILDRMIYANALLTERKFTRDQVAEKIKDKFSVSIYTARNDINNTYGLFVSIKDDYKRYTLFHHIEQIDQLILKWKDDKSLAPLLPKLIAERTRAIAAMPVEPSNPNVPAPVIILKTTTEIVVKMSVDDAISEADKLIEFEKNHEYIDFVDGNDGEN